MSLPSPEHQIGWRSQSPDLHSLLINVTPPWEWLLHPPNLRCHLTFRTSTSILHIKFLAFHHIVKTFCLWIPLSVNLLPHLLLILMFGSCNSPIDPQYYLLLVPSRNWSQLCFSSCRIQFLLGTLDSNLMPSLSFQIFHIIPASIFNQIVHPDCLDQILGFRSNRIILSPPFWLFLLVACLLMGLAIASLSFSFNSFFLHICLVQVVSLSWVCGDVFLKLFIVFLHSSKFFLSLWSLNSVWLFFSPSFSTSCSIQ